MLDRRGRVAATGYNGKPSGACNDATCYREGLPPGAAGPKCCLHAEQNCLSFSDFSRIQGGTLYVTGLPCEDCALMIAQSGVGLLVGMEDPRAYNGLEILSQYGFCDSKIQEDGYGFSEVLPSTGQGITHHLNVLIVDPISSGLQDFREAVIEASWIDREKPKLQCPSVTAPRDPRFQQPKPHG